MACKWKRKVKFQTLRCSAPVIFALAAVTTFGIASLSVTGRTNAPWLLGRDVEKAMRLSDGKLRAVNSKESTNLTMEFAVEHEKYNASWVEMDSLLYKWTEKNDIVMSVKKLNTTAEVPQHKMADGELFASRLRKIREACQKNPDVGYSSHIHLQRMIQDENHRALMCVIPKAACTTWKSVMYYLMGRSTLEDAFHIASANLVIDRGQVKSLASELIFANETKLNRQGIVNRLNGFTKFTVSRHPFNRLVSAYKNKFEKEVSPYIMRHGRRIAKKNLESFLGSISPKIFYKKKESYLASIKAMPAFQRLNDGDRQKVMNVAWRGFTGNITFEEFLRYGILAEEKKFRSFDVHWRPQHVLCNPCAFDFDFVIRFEDLERESNALLRFLQRDDSREKWITIPEKRIAATDNVAKEFFDKIPSNVKERLRKVYEKDFLYFNYNPNIF